MAFPDAGFELTARAKGAAAKCVHFDTEFRAKSLSRRSAGRTGPQKIMEDQVARGGRKCGDTVIKARRVLFVAGRVGYRQFDYIPIAALGEPGLAQNHAGDSAREHLDFVDRCTFRYALGHAVERFVSPFVGEDARFVGEILQETAA